MENNILINLNIRLKNGDHDAFVLLYTSNSNELYHFVNKYIKDSSICDDIIHDTFLNLWNARTRISPEHPIKHYLFRICRNLIYKEIKKQVNTALLFNTQLAESLEVQGTECVERSLLDKEYATIYNLAVDILPPQRKRIFMMSREEGLSYKEIAGNLEISTQTVKEHMSLAMKTIKDYIAKEHDILLKITLLWLFFNE
ncbi:RNA polymerase sigma-70 factor [Sphingobacterium humi]|uniref:RNA polymerase sigma-70 factor n=1 Tax=Sphingobacterium humi TaxID=1796905 RepID=A0A6N8KTP0_9SPHI|nr:RNA polymerase sigma-70 factor [Sphingobacterium humi]MVZ60795.1 RNA polymerase sigma-70 factor [Sphingobacterium humi]